MPLPKYDKSKRRKSFEILPKGAYVVKILNAKEVPNKTSNGTHLEIAFDIAEGERKDFYMKQYEASSSEDKKFPRDAYFYINIPSDGCAGYVWDNYNTFFADLEDSNGGFVYDGAKDDQTGNIPALKGKLIGGKFRNEQTEYNGRIYDHTRLQWTCPADDVRNGKPGPMPQDKLITPSVTPSAAYTTPGAADGFMSVSGDASEIPF